MDGMVRSTVGRGSAGCETRCRNASFVKKLVDGLGFYLLIEIDMCVQQAG